MNSRERVRKAINHEEADRVPIDIGGTKVTGVHVDHYVALGRYLDLDVEPPVWYSKARRASASFRNSVDSRVIVGAPSCAVRILTPPDCR